MGQRACLAHPMIPHRTAASGTNSLTGRPFTATFDPQQYASETVPERSILVVDDHPLMMGAISAVLSALDPSIRVRPAVSLAEALTRLSEDRADLVVLDLGLPDTVGYEGLKRLRQAYPETAVVVCSGRIDYRTVCDALDLGAAGFIPKSFTQDGFFDAFRKILDGNVYLPRIDGQSFRCSVPAPALPLSIASVAEIGLSPRQLDVLRLLIRGYPNKLICRHLNLAEGTVKVHVSAILAKLGARTRTEAIIAVSHLDLGALSSRAADGAPYPTAPGAGDAQSQSPRGLPGVGSGPAPR